MAKEIQTRTATCPTHGPVEATREMPRPGFPIFLYAARRLVAAKRPYRCPTCGASTTD
jgi:hypothetical protein